MEKLLSSKSAIGESITVDGNTIIPVLSLGFGVDGGTGKGKNGPGGEGSGGGGGVKPVAVIIVNKDGVRVEPIGGPPGALEKLGSAIGAAIQKRGEKSEEEERAA